MKFLNFSDWTVKVDIMYQLLIGNQMFLTNMWISQLLHSSAVLFCQFVFGCWLLRFPNTNCIYQHCIILKARKGFWKSAHCAHVSRLDLEFPVKFKSYTQETLLWKKQNCPITKLHCTRVITFGWINLGALFDRGYIGIHALRKHLIMIPWVMYLQERFFYHGAVLSEFSSCAVPLLIATDAWYYQDSYGP